MKILISWSGARSKQVAAALSTLLPDALQDVETWMSDSDIHAGTQWNAQLSATLDDSRFGVLCLTPENLSNSWLLFEAGAIAKGVSESRVVPYRFALKAADVPYPLAQFQGVDADEQGTKRLVRSINAALDTPMAQDRLERVFSRWWPDLDAKLREVTQEISGAPRRGDREILEEILEHVRELSNPSRNDWGGSRVPRSAVWKTVHQVDQKDLEQMTDEGIRAYIAQVDERAPYVSGDEDNALCKKSDLAREVLKNREKGA